MWKVGEIEIQEESTLTIEILDDLLAWLRPYTIYFLEDPGFPKVNKAGKDALFKVPMFGEEVWIMHPDVVPLFLIAARKEGLIPYKFDVEKAARRDKPTWDWLEKLGEG